MPKKPTKAQQKKAEFQRRSDAAKLGHARKRERERAAFAEFKRRSDAAKKGHETRRAREREEFGPVTGDEWIIEEPIDVVGGKRYKKKGK